METDNKHIALTVSVNLCRFLIGMIFLFSGFVKAVDPLGSCYKIQDYLTAFGMSSLIPNALSLLLAMLLAAFEFCLGVCLFFGVKRKLSSLMAVIFMCVMTPLTLYLAIADPVSDCGCFGDAVVLTNWQTFSKNVCLLVMSFFVYKEYRLIASLVTEKIEWIFSLYSSLFIFAFMIFCLYHLPVIDFRPYKIGSNIAEGMSIPEGKKPSVYSTEFVLEKEGKQQRFTIDNYPDRSWTFVKADNILVEKGYEPPIHDFSLQLVEDGEDITEEVLNDCGYTFLLISHSLASADEGNIDLINDLYEYAAENGYKFYGVTSSSEDDIELWRDKTGAEYPFCQMDDIPLKTIVRSNPGVVLLKGGTILNKWSGGDLPDEYSLKGKLEDISLGSQKEVSDLTTLANVSLWFFLPLMLIIGVDVAYVRLKRKKK